MQTIIITGSLAYDHVMKYDGLFSDSILPNQLQNLSVSFRIQEKQEHYGGCAGNIAYNLSLLGEKPIIVGVAGSDFGEYKKWLEKNEIDPGEIMLIKNRDTSAAYIMTDQRGNQITSFYAGAAAENPPIYLENYKNSDALILIGPDNVHRMLHFIKECQRLKIPYLFDPGQQLPEFTKEQLIEAIRLADGILVNEYELHLLMEKTEYNVKNIYQHADFLITTFGEKGSRIENRSQIYEIPIARPRQIIDPTGCGDAYRAGILKGLKEGYDLQKTGRIAALLATYALEHQGTQNHHFTLQEFWKRYEQEFGK